MIIQLNNIFSHLCSKILNTRYVNSSLQIILIFFLQLIFFLAVSFSKQKPNFLLIVTHSHSVNTIGAYNGTFSNSNPTPNLDRIASGGTVFKNAFCVNSSAGPSSASLLTGNYSHINGILKNGDNFDFSNHSVHELLHKAGYETAIIGRWDLGTKPEYFDFWNILVDKSEKFNPEFISMNEQKRIEGHSTDIITDIAIQWLNKRQNNRPYFLIIQYNATSEPWMPAIRHLNLYDDTLLPEPNSLKTEHVGKSSPARYQQMDISEELDFKNDLFFYDQNKDKNESSKEIESKAKLNLSAMTPEQLSAWSLSWRPKNEAFLRESISDIDVINWKFQRFIKNYLRCVRGIDENLLRLEEIILKNKHTKTYFIYTSNKSRFLGENGWFGSKWFYDLSSQIPLIISSDLTNSSNNTINSIVKNIDIAPTILDFADIDNLQNCQGTSLKKIVFNNDSNTSLEGSVYYHHHDFPGPQMVAKHYGIRTIKHKLIHYYQFNEWEFFDIISDPLENDNLYNKQIYKSEITNLKKTLKEFRLKYDDTTDISIMPDNWRKMYRGPEARKK